MGILDFNVSNRTISSSAAARSDFEEGLKIVEIVDGKERTVDQILLVGTLMPKDSIAFGGSQKIIKEYYPGSSEPTVQILGPREDDVLLGGTISLKKISDLSLYSKGKESAAVELQQLMDAMRIRGNLVKVTLGEWKRYGFIESGKFTMRTMSDIDYELNISVVGFNLPKNYYLLDGTDGDIIAPNKELTNKLVEQMSLNQNKPTEMPVSVSDVLNSAIADVAEKVSLVTNFVDSIISDAEKLNASAQRALGLIKNARAFISRSSRRIGSISRSVENLGSNFVDETQKALATLRNVEHLHKVERNNKDLSRNLRSLQDKFAAFISTIPLRRHFTTEGDTLQKLSVKYYGSADSWKKIMDHNKLTSTELKKGVVIEIPRV